MHAGKRDRLIQIMTATVSQSAESGEKTQSWGILDEVWASVRPLSGREAIQFQAQQIQASLFVVFNIRYRPDVTPSEDLQIIHEGRPYDITATFEPETAPRRTELDVFAFARAEAPPAS